MTTKDKLEEIYNSLFSFFGPQGWWPGDAQIEIIIGAILTQNTSWSNVEKAINNLKKAGVLNADSLYGLETERLAEFIRPAGYYNIKAARLRAFLKWFFDNYNGSFIEFEAVDTLDLRHELLGIKGIGRETADSILLYAFERPVFVVDAYTARIVHRHQLIDSDADYEQLRELFQSNLPEDVKLFNEYHALLVRTGKEFCRPKARCKGCPLEGLPHDLENEAEF